MLFKCKMCGGELSLQQGVTVVECDYCGSRQTVPNADSDKKIQLYDMANKHRAACEFDKAYTLYEKIVTNLPEEAEAYWGLCLCKYGIEYVTDPASGRKIPTCHRSSYESILDDDNFEQALENAVPEARAVYREEAKRIEEIRKGIIEISNLEEPYDIFICYKETDLFGARTEDSVLAQDVYDSLRAEGYRVFFSRITLEDKLGREYEPYIFAALNSAKIMLVFGTDPEYFQAVWVKNEWSRFLQMMGGRNQKMLIPCYKNIDPATDMPKQFVRLQSQDMSKLGWKQDLLRGIGKIHPSPKAKAQAQSAATVVVQASANAVNDITKDLASMQTAIKNEDWDMADQVANTILKKQPDHAETHFTKFLIENEWSSLRVARYRNGVDVKNNIHLKRARMYGDDNLKRTLSDFEEFWELERVYYAAFVKYEALQFKEAQHLFHQLGSYKNSEQMKQACAAHIKLSAEVQEPNTYFASRLQKTKPKLYQNFVNLDHRANSIVLDDITPLSWITSIVMTLSILLNFFIAEEVFFLTWAIAFGVKIIYHFDLDIEGLIPKLLVIAACLFVPPLLISFLPAGVIQDIAVFVVYIGTGLICLFININSLRKEALRKSLLKELNSAYQNTILPEINHIKESMIEEYSAIPEIREIINNIPTNI